MDITPLIPEHYKHIQGYGSGYFTINGERIENNILVFPHAIHRWNVSHWSDLTLSSFQEVSQADVELLLIGCGAFHQLLPTSLRLQLKAQGVICEVMTTGAACRTYNVLLSEGRQIAAALFSL